MIRIQTKLAVAFLGSAFLVFMIWDRGTKKSELDVGPIEDHVQDQQHYDSDRIIHRSKRQAVGTKLNVIYRQFDNLQSCCSVPSLIPSDALDACEANYVMKRKGSANKVRNKKPQANRNLFTTISNLFARQNNRRASIFRSKKQGTIIKKSGNKKKVKGLNSRVKRQGAAQKITLQSVGYTDCVFDYLNYLNDSALDLNLIEDNFKSQVEKVDNTWTAVVQDAMYMCEEPAACASPEMINVGGKFRSIKPTILMICMRKQMILNCPGNSRTGRDFKCNSGIASLKSLNTHTLG